MKNSTRKFEAYMEQHKETVGRAHNLTLHPPFYKADDHRYLGQDQILI